jgi:hypothetical protein
MPRRGGERSTAAVSSELFHRQIDRVESPHKSRADSHSAAKLTKRDATRRRRIKREDSQKEAKNRSRRFDFEAKDLKGGEFSANSRTGEAEGVRGQAGSQSIATGKRILQCIYCLRVCTYYIVQYYLTKIKLWKFVSNVLENLEETRFKVRYEKHSSFTVLFCIR